MFARKMKRARVHDDVASVLESCINDHVETLLLTLASEKSVDFRAKDSKGRSCLWYACRYGHHDLVSTILDFCPDLVFAFRSEWVLENKRDPLGVLRAVSRYVRLPNLEMPSTFVFEEGFVAPEVIWAFLRIRMTSVLQFPQDPSAAPIEDDMWLNDPDLPVWVDAYEDCLVDVMQNDMERAETLMELQHVNPFVCRTWPRASFTQPDQRVLECWLKYTQWRPCRARRSWYGPCFEKRALAMIIVLKRLVALPRELEIALIQHLARAEIVSIDYRSPIFSPHSIMWMLLNQDKSPFVVSVSVRGSV